MIGSLVVALALGSAAMAAPDAATSPATILQSQQWTLVSTVNGRSYRIQIALPVGPAPAAGDPVLCVTDDAGVFGSFTDTFRIRSFGNKSAPAVIVGISYPLPPK